MQELQPELLQIQQKQDVDAVRVLRQGHRQPKHPPRILPDGDGGRLPTSAAVVFPHACATYLQNVTAYSLM